MAAGGAFTATYQPSLTSCNVLSWSEDNRLALATDGGIFILELLIWPSHTDSVCHFGHANIPLSSDPPLTLVPFELKDLSKSLSMEEMHTVIMDSTIHPKGCSSKGYKNTVWSPPGGDKHGRSVLAAVTHDHEVFIFSTTDTKKTWTKVADLAKVYCKESSLPEELTFDALKEQSYKLAAMEIAWSPSFHSADQKETYSFLAVGMKNGDIVLWKVNLPCLNQIDCSVAKVIPVDSSIPTSLSWCPHFRKNHRAVLAVGYNSGVIHLIDITSLKEITVKPVCIYKEKDDLRVSCMSWKKLQTNVVLISSKEQYLLAHKVNMDGKLTVTKSDPATGAHWMMGMGLSCCERLSVLSSADGLIQKIHVTELQTKEVVLDTSVLPFPTDEKVRWTCHGIALSPNGCFCAAAFFPVSSYCHLLLREPLKLQVIHVGDTEFIHEYGGPLSKGGDVYEAYRQGICTEVDPLELLKEHRLNVTDLNEQPLKALKIYRFFFLVLETLLRNWPDQLDKDFVPISKDIERYTDEIHRRLIQQKFEAVNKLKRKLSPPEQKILTHMCQWLEGSPDESIREYSESETCIKVMGRVMDIPPATCAICQQKFKFDHSSCRCDNGHIFGVCCITLLPVDMPPYRKCQVCGAVSLQLKDLTDISWLGADLTRCSLCEGQLL